MLHAKDQGPRPTAEGRNEPAGADFLSLAGPGFRDFTRIAASDPKVWCDILLSNREEIIKQSLRFRHTLDAMEHMMKSSNSEGLEELVRTASDSRAHWHLPSNKPRS